MLFISHEEWLQGTYNRFSRRSTELKALDEAIKAANESSADDATVQSWYAWDGTMTETAKAAAKLDEACRKEAIYKVNQAFTKWVGARNSDWRTSGRDSSGTVTRLYQQLTYYTSRGQVPTSESEALQLIKESRDQSIPLLFKGCTVKGMGASMMQKTTIRKSSATLAAAFAKLIKDLVQDSFGVSMDVLASDPHAGSGVLSTVMDQMKDVLAQITPGVGLGVSAASLVFHAAKTATGSISSYELLKVHAKLPEGDSRAAIESVRVWQARDIALHASAAARASANAASQIASILSAGTATPLQVAVGIANAFVALAEIVADLGVQYREANKLTKFLNEAQTLDRNIFAQCPLVGAYYLLNTPTSHIALAFVNIGAPAWREEVEVLKKWGGLKTVITESARLIDVSRYRILRADKQKFREREGKTLKVKALELVGREPLRGSTPMQGTGSRSPS